MRKILSFLFLLSSSFCIQAFSTELVTNGNFSGGKSAWTTNTNTSWTNSSTYDIFTPGDGVLWISNTCPSLGCLDQGDGFFNQTVNVPVTGTYGLTFDYGIRAITGASVISANTNTLSISYGGSSVGTIQFTRDLATSSISINRSGATSTASFAVDTSYPFSASYSLSSSSGSKALEFSYDNRDIFFFIDNISFSLLAPSGPSSSDTQSSLTTLSKSLRSSFNATLMSSNFANMNTYDCNLFDKNNMCISAGGRITTIDNPSSHHSAAVVVLGHKISPHIRIGGFLDQSVNHNMPSGVDMSNKNPMAGAFLVWNHQADGLGLQMKLANAYLDKDVTTSRAVIGTSEAGRGRTDLNTQSYVGELSYAFTYQDSTIVRPYFALRYTRIKQDGYTEDTTAAVTSPLTYAKLSDRSTSALMGVKVNHSLTPRTNLTASLGVEQDLDHKSDQLIATGVSGLTSENFYNNIRHTRPVASLGAYYAVAKNQRLSGDIYYQQLPFQSTDSATAYVNYMIGF